MEQSLIDILFYNNGMREKLEADPELDEIERRCDKLANELREMLTEQQRDLFEKYKDSIVDEYTVATRLYFRQGMKSGIRIVAEGVSD